MVLLGVLWRAVRDRPEERGVSADVDASALRQRHPVRGEYAPSPCGMGTVIPDKASLSQN